LIRSLSRGLDIIAIFNKSDSASASEISKKLKMPRSTVYRILETLIEKGFIYQHSFDRRFRLTQKVSSLSDGYTDEDHMANISRKFLEKGKYQSQIFREVYPRTRLACNISDNFRY